MPTLSEFTLTLRLRRDQESGIIWTVFRFATIREFRSFQYEIQVDDSFDPERRSFDFKIHGVQAPKNLMPSSGSAAAELRYAGLRGEYTANLVGARRSESFSFSVEEDAIVLGEPPSDGGIGIEVEKGIENVRP